MKEEGKVGEWEAEPVSRSPLAEKIGRELAQARVNNVRRRRVGLTAVRQMVIAGQRTTPPQNLYRKEVPMK